MWEHKRMNKSNIDINKFKRGWCREKRAKRSLLGASPPGGGIRPKKCILLVKRCPRPSALNCNPCNHAPLTV